MQSGNWSAEIIHISIDETVNEKSYEKSTIFRLFLCIYTLLKFFDV